MMASTVYETEISRGDALPTALSYEATHYERGQIIEALNFSGFFFPVA